MSAFIGRFPGRTGGNFFELQVSRAGVEISPRNEDTATMTPLEARTFAAALVVAAEEGERMRRMPEES